MMQHEDTLQPQAEHRRCAGLAVPVLSHGVLGGAGECWGELGSADSTGKALPYFPEADHTICSLARASMEN